jgi:hypothetical protein
MLGLHYKIYLSLVDYILFIEILKKGGMRIPLFNGIVGFYTTQNTRSEGEVPQPNTKG